MTNDETPADDSLYGRDDTTMIKGGGGAITSTGVHPSTLLLTPYPVSRPPCPLVPIIILAT